MKRLMHRLMVFAAIVAAAPAALGFGSTQCAADRFGSSLNCTANDLLVSNLKLAGSSPPAVCSSGGTITVDLTVTVNFGSASRYDLGVFFPADEASAAANQKLPSSAGGPSVCSVKTLSIPPFPSLNGNACGDGGSNLIQDTTLYTVTLPCVVAPGSGGYLSVPYLLTYNNSASATCTGPDDVVAETKAKCNAPTGGSASVPVLVMPAISITDNLTTTYSGNTHTYLITISNQSGTALSGVSLSDPLAANLNFTSVACTGETGGAVCPNSAGVTLANLMGGGIPLPDIPNGGSLTFAVGATVTGTPATVTNTARVLMSGETLSASDTDNVLSPVAVAKSFSPDTIELGNTSTLTIALTNPNAIALTGVSFSDTYPSTSLQNAALPTTTCPGGTASGVVGGSSVGLTGATVPAGGSCVVTVTVKPTAAGSYANTTGPVTTGNAGPGAAASATLAVNSPPLVSKTFDPEVIGVLDTSTLTITLTNPNAVAATGVAFTDNYPVGMSNASSPGLTNTCGGSATAAAGGTSLRLSGGTIPAGGSCTVSVKVTGLLGGLSVDYVNSSGSLTTANVGTGTASSATLTVTILPSAQKKFTPDTIGVNGTSQMTITLTNPWIGAITGVAFTDNYPANMKNAATPALSNTCGGTATAAANGTSLSLSGGTIPAGFLTDPSICTISVNVTATAAGDYTNHTGTMSTSHWLFRTIADASATLKVLSPVTVATSFTPAAIMIGGSSTFSVVLTNPNAGTAITGVAFTYTNPGGLLNVGSATSTCGGTVSATAGTLSLSGGTVPAGGSCTVTIGVTSSVAGSYETGTPSVTTANAGNTGPASATLLVSGAQSFNAFETSTAAGSVTGRIYTKLAGSPFGLDVVAITGGSQATGFSGNVKLELVANGTPGTGYGAEGCPTSGSVIQTINSAAIAGGRSTANFPAVSNAYQDVRVRITYAGATPPVVVCSSDGFAIRPTATVLTTTANATPPGASATPAIKAGEAFILYASTASGTNYQGTLTLDTSRRSAQTTSQDTTQQSGGTVGTLSPSTLMANQVPASANANYTEAGYLYLAAGAYRDENYTAIDQSSDCVMDASDSNSDGVPDNLSDTPIGGRYGCWVGNKTAVSLGRFVPDHFGVAGLVQNRSDWLPNASTFTYMDEPMRLTLTVKAYRRMSGSHSADPDDDITRNYAGVFAKLAATTLCAGSTASCAADPANDDRWFNTDCSGADQCMGLGAFNDAATDTGLSGRLAVDTGVAAPSGSWTAGVGTFSVHLKIKRNSDPDGPYDTLKFGAMPRDADGVTLPGTAATDSHKVDLDVTTGNTLASNPDGTHDRRWIFDTKARFGRLWLGNAYGSDRRDLTIPFEAQYWNGMTFVRNAADSLTEIKKANIGLGNHAPTGFDASVDLAHIPVGPFAVSAGAGSFLLAKPTSVAGSPIAGSVDIVFALGTDTTVNASWTPTQGPSTGAGLGYLRGKWYGGAYDRDPTARATFGIFGGRKGPIYIRESY